MCIFTLLLHTAEGVGGAKIPMAVDIMTPQYTNSVHMFSYMSERWKRERGRGEKKGRAVEAINHFSMLGSFFPLSLTQYFLHVLICAIRNHKSWDDAKFVTFQLKRFENYA